MTEIFVNNVKIDLKENIPVPLTYSVADITQPDKRNTAFSKTIVLPSSKTNDQLFGWIFEIGKEAISTQNGVNFAPDFNPNLKADVKIFEDNILQFAGIIQLLEIKLNGQSINYECVVFGSLKNIFANIENYLLENLDLSEYDHGWTRTNMKNSWDTSIIKNGGAYVNFSAGNPTGEGYVYPTIDYGFGQSSTYIQTKHTFPAVYVREYFTKMFDVGGYSWNSNFFDSTLFKRLIIPFTGSGEIKLTDTAIEQRSFQASRSGTQNINYDRPALSELYPVSVTVPYPVIFNNDSTGGNFDNWPAYDTTTGYWTCPATGYYSFSYTATATLTTSTGNLSLVWYITQLNTTTSVYGNLASGTVTGTGTTLSGSKTLTANNVYITKGTKVYCTIGGNTSNTSAVNIDIDVTSGTFYNTPISLPISIGETMLLNAATPKNVKCKDFFTSIIKMFNLYVQPDPDDENKLNIEPLIDFYTDTSIDWTSKIDYSKEVLIKPCSYIEAKNYNFKYKQDDDLYNSLYRETYGVGYGDKTVEVINDFVSEKKDTELIFSATPTVGNGSNTMAIPRIVSQDKDTLEIQPYAANIRILYYGGVKSAGGSWVWIDDSGFTSGSTNPINRVSATNGSATVTCANPAFSVVAVGDLIRIDGLVYTISAKASSFSITLNAPFAGTTGTLKEWYYKLISTQKETNYSYAGHLDDPYTPTFDLLWNKPKEIFWGTPSDIGASYTTNNIYNKYWSQFINEITDKDSKVVTYYVHLRPIDIFTLDFRTPIYVNGVKFRLNKIIDYDPQSSESTKVELSKIKRYAAFVADTDEVISANDPTNYDILEGGLDEVRSLTAISPMHVVEGSIDQVIGTTGESIKDIINGG